MNKKLFFIAFFMLCINIAIAQTGTIAAISTPTELTAGDTVDITFEYTSDTAGFYEIQLLHLKSNGSTIWLTNVTFDRGPIQITSTPIQVTIQVTVPSDTPGTVDLTNPAANWGWFGKLDLSQEIQNQDDFAFFSEYPVTFVHPDLTLSTFNNHSKKMDHVYFDYHTKKLIFDSNSSLDQVKLMDINGKQIMEIDTKSDYSEIHLSHLEKGVYILFDKGRHYKFMI